MLYITHANDLQCIYLKSMYIQNVNSIPMLGYIIINSIGYNVIISSIGYIIINSIATSLR